jgi:hypothetical protein
MDSSSKHNYLGFLLVGVSTFMFLNYTRWLRRLRRKQFQKRKKDGSVNIGGKLLPPNVPLLGRSAHLMIFLAIFGMDIGGTLTKIVYFEANMDETSDSSATMSGQSSENPNARPPEIISSPGLKKNRSFVNLEEPEQKAALRELYEYMDLEKELAIRDDLLSFRSHILGGKIHFLHFETR